MERICRCCGVLKPLSEYPKTIGGKSMDGYSRRCILCTAVALAAMKEKYNHRYARKFKIDIIAGEVWKSVVGYEDCYEVSSYGRVKSIGMKYRGDMLLKQPISRYSGYKQVSLGKDGKMRVVTVHRLVAEHFLPPEPLLDGCRIEINHIDLNKENNHYKNLEWSTTSKNMLHRFAHIPRYTKTGNVYQVRIEDNSIVGVYKSFVAASAAINSPLKSSHIYIARAARLGESVFGYYWQRR